ncbi:hypothetical protein BACCOP_02370 [Phocaeicola coprocola DSM 17136]|uniref:Uncharacterized protein n=1 Tax=Phocaeicola coprocola DSM 17136 TaxID=470145 RepID=B3JKE2_9BACT|nr:hypothetical protein BACCOP_02370 [Phocaeicola coprocola DSM 17136]
MCCTNSTYPYIYQTNKYLFHKTNIGTFIFIVFQCLLMITTDNTETSKYTFILTLDDKNTPQIPSYYIRQ